MFRFHIGNYNFEIVSKLRWINYGELTPAIHNILIIINLSVSAKNLQTIITATVYRRRMMILYLKINVATPQIFPRLHPATFFLSGLRACSEVAAPVNFRHADALLSRYMTLFFFRASVISPRFVFSSHCSSISDRFTVRHKFHISVGSRDICLVYHFAASRLLAICRLMFEDSKSNICRSIIRVVKFAEIPSLLFFTCNNNQRASQHMLTMQI